MDQLRSLRWPLVVVSLALTLGALFVGNWLVRDTTVEEPLNAFLQSQPAVESFSRTRTPSGVQIQVTLKAVPNLAETYLALEAGVRQIAGTPDVELVLTDRRTPELTAAYYRINPLLHEAMATGHYGDLVERVEERAATLGVAEAAVWIDSGRLYLQLHQGEAYLYAVLPRPDAPGGLVAGLQDKGGQR